MKSKLMIIACSLLILSVTSILGSLLFSGLYYFRILSLNQYKILLAVYSFVIYFLIGLYLGKKTDSGLLIELGILSGVIFILALIFHVTFNQYLWLGLKFVLLFIVSFFIYKK